MKGQYNQIKGLSERRRLPRLGKIRLGIKKVAKSGNEYPSETDYFVCPPEVEKIYGERPKAIDVLIPVEDLTVFFPTAYKAYKSNMRLACKGDGETAERRDDETGVWKERECPCEWLNPEGNQKKKCAPKATLMVILPKINPGGVYQIDTGSYNSIVDINSGVDYIRAMVGRISLIPLKLIREERITHHDGKKAIHYTLQLRLPDDWKVIGKMLDKSRKFTEFLLPAPVEDGPEPTDIPEGVRELAPGEEAGGETIDTTATTKNVEPPKDQKSPFDISPPEPDLPPSPPPERHAPQTMKDALWDECQGIGMDTNDVVKMVEAKLGRKPTKEKPLTIGDVNLIRKEVSYLRAQKEKEAAAAAEEDGVQV